MRKLLVPVAVTVALVATGTGLVLASVAPSHSTKLGTTSPHFACVAVGNIGICVGPPTRQA